MSTKKHPADISIGDLIEFHHQGRCFFAPVLEIIPKEHGHRLFVTRVESEDGITEYGMMGDHLITIEEQ